MKIGIAPRALGETAGNSLDRPLENGVRRLSIFASAPGDALRDGGVVMLELGYEKLEHVRIKRGENGPADCVGLASGSLRILAPYVAQLDSHSEVDEQTIIRSDIDAANYIVWRDATDEDSEGEDATEDKHGTSVDRANADAEKREAALRTTYRNLQNGFADMDFDDREVLVEGGYQPSFAAPKFVAQMVFAIVTTVKSNFEQALGREIVTGLDRKDKRSPGVLTLNPWASPEAQAWYERETNSLNFGFYESLSDTDGYSRGSIVYTGLSHDVVVHELCHALLDSVRPNLMLPVNMDVAAFHEAFCDIIAVLQRFSYPDLVTEELRAERGQLSGSEMLKALARSFARTAGHGPNVRDIVGNLQYDNAPADPHGRSEVLVQAIYRAFLNVADKRIQSVVDLASNGTGILPDGALPPPVLDAMSKQVQKTAQMFLRMLVRALDYCPPVGIEFFDVLQSVLAADRDLVSHDESQIRKAWIDAFRESGIYAPSSEYYSEESLVSRIEVARDRRLRCEALSFGETQFRSSPGKPLALGPAIEQIRKVIKVLSQPEWLEEIFEDNASDSKVTLVSLRSFARPGPSGMTQFGTSIELVREDMNLSEPFEIDGATLVFDSEGRLAARCRRRFKKADLNRSRQYVDSSVGKAFWTSEDGDLIVRENYQRRMCML